MMKQKYYLKLQLLILCPIIFCSAIFAQTTAFTYQGKLTNNGTPATGSYEMRFTLYDAPSGGFEIGTPKTIPNIVVTNGIFTVVITTGDWSFDQNERYMEIAVRPQGNVAPFTVLAPLQRITQTPRAIFANTAALAGFAASSGNAASLSGLSIEQFVLKNVNGEIVAPRFENLADDPAPASAKNTGQVYFNTTTNNLMVSNGTEWVNISKPRVQTFTGVTASSPLFCFIGFTPVIRTVTFTKSSAASRLRITFKDTADADGDSTSGFDLEVFVRIDGVDIINPTPLKMYFKGKVRLLQSFPTPIFATQVKDSFTGVGYADGVAAGTHTLTTHYKSNGNIATEVTCRSSSNPYLIEIEEVP